MNYSSLARKYAHPGVWGNENTTTECVNVSERTMHQQLWAALSTMRKRDDQWVTVIGKPPRTLIAQLIAAGIRPDRIRKVSTSNSETALWATEQALLIDNSQLVIAWLTPYSGRDKQRIQLAAKASKALNFIFAPDYQPAAMH